MLSFHFQLKEKGNEENNLCAGFVFYDFFANATTLDAYLSHHKEIDEDPFLVSM